MSSIEQLRINMASLRKRHATAYEPHAEQSIRDATKRRHLTTSGLDLEAFDRVYSTFVEESRIASSEHGIKDYRRLSSLDHFATVIRVVAPGLVSTDNLAANLFEAFDSDGTGSVDVDELFCGISILSPMGESRHTLVLSSLLVIVVLCSRIVSHLNSPFLSALWIEFVILSRGIA